MRAYVFTDKALERYAGRFVWLAIDTEKTTNAGFLAKYPINVWPTLLVVDPRKESVLLRYAGGATVPQLIRLLGDAEKLAHGKGLSSSDSILLAADKLSNEKKHAEAAKLYEQAIEKASPKWSRLGRAAESYVFALHFSRDLERCATQAPALYRRIRGTVSAANVTSVGLSCATQIDPANPRRSELIAQLERATREVLDDPNIPLSGDNRSGLYESLADVRAARKDEAGAHALREEWARFLEGQAASAKTPEQRTVYDSHRLSVYIGLGTPEKAIPMLEESERDLPDDYNPPARLALAYFNMKKYDDALAATDRALPKAYGPRKLSILRRRADILLGKGDKEAARQTLKDAIDYVKSLPGDDRSDWIATLEKKLGAIAD